MDRDEFMNLVYDELHSDGDNNRANRIIDAADEYAAAQPEPHYDEWCDSCKEYDKEKHCCPRWNKVIKSTIEELKTVQPVATDINVGDKICRKAAIEAVTDELDMIDHVPKWVFDRLEWRLKQLPSAQLESCEERERGECPYYAG